ncbi:hypothetical protein GWI33_012039, partial [Rhynchophorus ferrugineus]
SCRFERFYTGSRTDQQKKGVNSPEFNMFHTSCGDLVAGANDKAKQQRRKFITVVRNAFRVANRCPAENARPLAAVDEPRLLGRPGL